MGVPVTFYRVVIIAVSKLRATIKRGNGKYNIKDPNKQTKWLFM